MKRNRKLTKMAMTALALSMLAAPTILPLLDVELTETVEAADKKQTVVFSPSSSQSQSKTITIPDLASVRNVSVDTGNVSYSVSGNKLTINVSGGTWVDRTWDDKAESKSVTHEATSSSNSFGSTYSYNSGGFTGTLNKSGGSSVKSGKYTAAHSKTHSEGRYQKMRKDYHRWNSSKKKWLYYRTNPHPDTDVPQTKNYNSGGYKGTLRNTRITHEITKYYSYPNNPRANQEHHYIDYRDTRHFTGTVTKPASDTRVWKQNYKGTVYKGGYKNYKYAYNVTVEYDSSDKVAPEASTSQTPTSITKDPVDVVVTARDVLTRVNSIESTSGLSNDLNYGRNLLRESDRRISNSNYNIAIYDLVEPIKDGEEVTMTLKGNLASSKTNFSLYNSGGTVHLTSLTPKGNGIYQATFKWKVNSSTNRSLYIYTLNNSQSGTSSIDWVKLERGKRATPYVPSDDTEARDNLVKESDASINSGSYNFNFDIDPKSLRGKEVTVSAHIDLVNGTAKDRNRIGFEPAIRFTDGSTQYFGVWHWLDQGKTFNGRISSTVKIHDKPIAGWAQRGMYVQIGGTKTTISKPKLEIGKPDTPWKQSKTKGNLASEDKISTWGSAYTKQGDAYNLNGSQTGLKIETSHLKPNTDYVLSFKLKKNSGTINNIAGHSTNFTSSGVYIDGVKKSNEWTSGNSFPNDTNPHEVKVYLRTNATPSSDPKLYIQPNRAGYGVNYNADVTDVYLEERPSYSRVFQVNSNGTYNFKVTDEKGNVRTVSHKVSNIDKEGPTASISGNPTAWTKNNVTLSVSASDALSGVKRIKNPAGTWVNGSSLKYAVSSNGTYSFVLEDTLGNQRTVSATVNRIDKTAPNGTITGNPTSWTKNNATLTFKATDSGGSGVKRVRQAGGSWVNGSTTSMTVSANGTYSFEVEDNAGNTKTVSTTVTKIDKTAPGGTISGNPTSWTNQNATLTFKATDSGGSGVKRVRQAGGSWVNGSTTSRTVSANGTYSFEVEDNAGNTKTVSVTVNRIDKTIPGGTISGNPTGWTNQNVTLTFKGTDSGGSGVKRVRQAGGTWVNGSTTSRTVSANGTYSFEVEDNAGSTKTVSVTVNRIDKVLPENKGATVYDARYTNGNTHWFIPGDKFRVEVTGYDKDSTMRYSYLRFSGDGNDNRAYHDWTQADGHLEEFSKTGGFTSITGGTAPYWGWTPRYMFNAQVNSTAGNRTFQVETYFRDRAHNVVGYIDTGKRIRTDATAPTITANVSSRAWGNGNVSVALTHSDAQSGIKTKQFKWSTSTATPTSWDNYSSTTTQSSAGTWYLHARAVDNVGHVTTKRFGPYRIDKTAPGGTISGNPTAWTNKDVVLTFNATDSGGSGVKRVRQAGGSWVNGSTTSMTVSKNGTYSFEVEDNAGNTKTVSVTVNRIDKTVPGGAISGNPTAWTNKDVVLTFNATDSGGSGVKRVKTPGGTWVNGSKTTYTVSKNGTYSFVVEDHAGNQKTVSVVVNRIDKSTPTLAITGNPSSWVGTDVSLTIKASDTGGSGVKHIVLPNGSTISGSQTVYTIPSNGKFTFKVVDVAGNERSYTIDVTKIDKTNPTGNVSPSTTNWTNKNVTLTVTAADGQSGIKEIVKPDGTKATTAPTTFIVERNGTYTFTIYDRVNNKITKTIKVSNIDKEAPSETVIEIAK